MDKGRNRWKVGLGITSAVNSTRFPIGLAVGAYLFQRGDITIGTVYLIWHYFEVTSIGV